MPQPTLYIIAIVHRGADGCLLPLPGTIVHTIRATTPNAVPLARAHLAATHERVAANPAAYAQADSDLDHVALYAVWADLPPSATDADIAALAAAPTRWHGSDAIDFREIFPDDDGAPSASSTPATFTGADGHQLRQDGGTWTDGFVAYDCGLDGLPLDAAGHPLPGRLLATDGTVLATLPAGQTA